MAHTQAHAIPVGEQQKPRLGRHMRRHFLCRHLTDSATRPALAASKAETAKTQKYAGLADRFIGQPVAVETSGVIGPGLARALT